MTKFSEKDLWFSVFTGFMTGLIAWQILIFLKVPTIYGFSTSLLFFVTPVIFILGVFLGYFLGQWLKFFDQFGKFAVIGFTNAAIDFGVLNFLIAQSGHDSVWWYAGMKAVSFLFASMASYFWNKYWAFNAGNTSGGGIEIGKFFTVAVLGLLINNLSASLVVHAHHSLSTVDSHTWANIGAVVGSAVALIFSFVGFKIAVFKK